MTLRTLRWEQALLEMTRNRDNHEYLFLEELASLGIPRRRRSSLS
jgi:hypothetical protein